MNVRSPCSVQHHPETADHPAGHRSIQAGDCRLYQSDLALLAAPSGRDPDLPGRCGPGVPVREVRSPLERLTDTGETGGRE